MNGNVMDQMPWGRKMMTQKHQHGRNNSYVNFDSGPENRQGRETHGGGDIVADARVAAEARIGAAVALLARRFGKKRLVLLAMLILAVPQHYYPIIQLLIGGIKEQLPQLKTRVVVVVVGHFHQLVRLKVHIK